MATAWYLVSNASPPTSKPINKLMSEWFSLSYIEVNRSS